MIEVKVFHRAIAEAVGNKSGLNFEALRLSKINLRTLKVSDNGRVSESTSGMDICINMPSFPVQVVFKSSVHVKTFLSLLTELCQLNVTSSAPRIGCVNGDSLLT